MKLPNLLTKSLKMDTQNIKKKSFSDIRMNIYNYFEKLKGLSMAEKQFIINKDIRK